MRRSLWPCANARGRWIRALRVDRDSQLSGGNAVADKMLVEYRHVLLDLRLCALFHFSLGRRRLGNTMVPAWRVSSRSHSFSACRPARDQAHPRAPPLARPEFSRGPSPHIATVTFRGYHAKLTMARTPRRNLCTDLINNRSSTKYTDKECRILSQG
jgi:hypothetical protein